jgi:hypothetical protein
MLKMYSHMLERCSRGPDERMASTEHRSAPEQYRASLEIEMVVECHLRR